MDNNNESKEAAAPESKVASSQLPVLRTKEINGEIYIHQEGHGCFCTIPLGSFPHFEEVSHKNARLIASAPEMLEALKVLLETANGDFEDERGEKAYMIPHECFDLAKSAIAKAEGKEVK